MESAAAWESWRMVDVPGAAILSLPQAANSVALMAVSAKGSSFGLRGIFLPRVHVAYMWRLCMGDARNPTVLSGRAPVTRITLGR